MTNEQQSFDVKLSDITLVTDPSHPLYDKRVAEKVEKEFVEDIQVNGQMSPIKLVREGEKLLVAYGRRRYMALELLGAETIRAEIDESVDTALKQISLMIRENEHRKDDNLVRKSIKLKRLWEEAELEYLEGQTPAEEVAPESMPEKAKLDLACQVFGVGKTQVYGYSLLAYNASPKVLKAADKPPGAKGYISGSVAIEIVKRNPESHEKQERELARILATNVGGKVKKENIRPIGERPMKAKEMMEIVDGGLISKKEKCGVKDLFKFAAGKMLPDELDGFKAQNEWVEAVIEGSGGGGVDDDGGDGEDEE